jgi:DNA-binding transcriptional regulator LsrR (DeoR family)
VRVIEQRRHGKLLHVGAERLTEALQDRAGVGDAGGRFVDAERLGRTARAAAHLLSSSLDLNASIGVAWGVTVSAIARHLPTKRVYNSEVVQMNVERAGELTTCTEMPYRSASRRATTLPASCGECTVISTSPVSRA